MTSVQQIEIGRVIRVGRGWVDVTVDRKIRRIGIRPDLLIRAGSQIQIINDQAFAVLPSAARQSIRKIH